MSGAAWRVRAKVVGGWPPASLTSRALGRAATTPPWPAAPAVVGRSGGRGGVIIRSAPGGARPRTARSAALRRRDRPSSPDALPRSYPSARAASGSACSNSPVTSASTANSITPKLVLALGAILEKILLIGGRVRAQIELGHPRRQKARRLFENAQLLVPRRTLPSQNAECTIRPCSAH